MPSLTRDDILVGVVFCSWVIGIPLLLGGVSSKISSIGYTSAVPIAGLVISMSLILALPNMASNIEQVGELNAFGRVRFGTLRLIEAVYGFFRFTSQNKALFYGISVLAVVGVGLWVGLPGQNQTFSFVYATLLFFQVLVAKNTHLLVLGSYNVPNEGESASQNEINQELRNGGTETAHNVQIKYRVFTETGTPIGPADSASLEPSNRSLEAGDVIEKVNIAYELNGEVDSESKYHIHILAQTGSGLSLLTASRWITKS
jgi:hypothetical protein